MKLSSATLGRQSRAAILIENDTAGPPSQPASPAGSRKEQLRSRSPIAIEPPQIATLHSHRLCEAEACTLVHHETFSTPGASRRACGGRPSTCGETSSGPRESLQAGSKAPRVWRKVLRVWKAIPHVWRTVLHVWRSDPRPPDQSPHVENDGPRVDERPAGVEDGPGTAAKGTGDPPPTTPKKDRIAAGVAINEGMKKKRAPAGATPPGPRDSPTARAPGRAAGQASPPAGAARSGSGSGGSSPPRPSPSGPPRSPCPGTRTP